MVRIFIIDYNLVVRRGLALLLAEHPELKVVGDSANTRDALTKMEALQPDVVVMDALNSGGDGLEAVSLIQQKLPQTKVLILTDSNKEEDFFKAMKAGVKGYLLKNLELEELIDSIRLVANGSAIVYASSVIKTLNGIGDQNRQSLRNGNGYSTLSEREKEILWWVAQGSSNREIATRCFISETTIKAHLRNILEKMGVKNRAQAVAMAMEKGIINPKVEQKSLSSVASLISR